MVFHHNPGCVPCTLDHNKHTGLGFWKGVGADVFYLGVELDKVCKIIPDFPLYYNFQGSKRRLMTAIVISTIAEI